MNDVKQWQRPIIHATTATPEDPIDSNFTFFLAAIRRKTGSNKACRRGAQTG